MTEIGDSSGKPRTGFQLPYRKGGIRERAHGETVVMHIAKLWPLNVSFIKRPFIKGAKRWSGGY